MLLKVGTLAKKTGLSVRTLHYYEEIGLLVPRQRTEAGHRLYGKEEAMRLQQILSLRQLGLPLEEIRTCLDEPEYALTQTIELHLKRLEEQIALQQRLYERLQAMARRLSTTEDVSLEDIIQTIEIMKMTDNYFTPEQQAFLKQRGEELGEAKIRQAETDWQTLIDAVRAEMNKGTDPTSDTVKPLAQQWKGLIEAFTGGNAGVAKSLHTMYKTEGPKKASRNMVDAEVFAYISQAMEALES